MVSRATSSPSAAKAWVAALSSFSLLRCASARNGRTLTITLATSFSCRNGGPSVYTVGQAEEAPFQCNPNDHRKEGFAAHDRAKHSLHTRRGSRHAFRQRRRRAIPHPHSAAKSPAAA